MGWDAPHEGLVGAEGGVALLPAGPAVVEEAGEVPGVRGQGPPAEVGPLPEEAARAERVLQVRLHLGAGEGAFTCTFLQNFWHLISTKAEATARM